MHERKKFLNARPERTGIDRPAGCTSKRAEVSNKNKLLILFKRYPPELLFDLADGNELSPISTVLFVSARYFGRPADTADEKFDLPANRMNTHADICTYIKVNLRKY